MMEEQRIQCIVCSAQFDCLADYGNHLIEVHAAASTSNAAASTSNAAASTSNAAALPSTSSSTTTGLPSTSSITNNANNNNNSHITYNITNNHHTTASDTCPLCPSSFASLDALVDHFKECHPTRALCTICRKPFKNSRSLNSHRSFKHPDEVRGYRRVEKEKLILPKDVREMERKNKIYRIWQSVLTSDVIGRVDERTTPTPRHDALERDFISYLQSPAVSLLDYTRLFHGMLPNTVTLERLKLEFSDMIEDILPYTCLCFCNLLIPLAKMQKHFNEDIALRLFEEYILTCQTSRWHVHCIIILKKKTPAPRQIRFRFARLYKRAAAAEESTPTSNEATNGRCKALHRLKQIKNYGHFLNTILYISARRSQHGVNAHMYHNLGYYISKTQKSHIRTECRLPPE